MVFFRKISAIAQKLFKSEDYNEYDLEVEGSWLFGLKYYLNVYAGDKKFRFLLDSGCECSLIPYRYLKYFTHSFVCEGLSGSISGHISTERTYFAFFGLEPGYTEQDTFTEYVGAPTKKTCPIFDDKIDGILGATFLSHCDVNLRNAKIRVYRNYGKIKELASDPFTDAFLEQLMNSEASAL